MIYDISTILKINVGESIPRLKLTTPTHWICTQLTEQRPLASRDTKANESLDCFLRYLFVWSVGYVSFE